MKTFKNLYPQIYALENLYLAARKARKRKTRKKYVEDFELHRERFLRKIQEELADETYMPSGYRQFYIYDPKKRLISAAPYRDRIVHHALCNVIQPLIERRFIYDTYSCRVGKGTLAAQERCRKYTNRFKYALKCDIKKYFQSIDHQILLEKIAGVIACRKTLELCRKIINSCCDETEPHELFDGDDLVSVTDRKKGLPIGNLTSQMWANLYLDSMDHLIKEVLRVPAYARYTDDFVLWSDDRKFLRESRDRIAGFLCRGRLKLHEGKTRIMACGCGVPFLGFRFYPELSPRLDGEAKRRFEIRTRKQVVDYKLGLSTVEEIKLSVFGWIQHARYGNVNGLLIKYRNEKFG